MPFDSFIDFVQMGKHGIYVWSAQAAFVATIVYNIVSIYLLRRDARRVK